ncbi:MAG TPA: GxxExxY protein [Cyclobacteriaceae bacterium]|nr:GxxExxY protein [Cyclobacteriaceae bacterium]
MNIETEKINDPITYKIIGCAMRVHATLGNGFQEVIYQRALAIEFKNTQISFERELEVPIYYSEEYIGTRRVDFLVENSIMVELKAITQVEDVHLAQGLNYLVAYKLDKGLLINFGAKSLEVKRLRHPRNKMPATIPKIQESINPKNPNADNE